MLVLSRWVGEKIILNPGSPDQITITVTEIDRRGKCRLGIEAPQSYRIFREEIVPGLPPAAVVEPGPAFPELHPDAAEPGEGP